MRVLQLLLAVCLGPCVAVSLFAQSTSDTPGVSDPQAVALLSRSLTVLTGGTTITDVTMAGTVTVTKSGALTHIDKGPATESETETLVATDTGQFQSQVTIQTPGGTETIVRGRSSAIPVLSVTAADGTSHVIDTSSALTPHPAWFYPAFLLQDALSSSYVASYVGKETWQGVPVEHISIWRASTSAGPVSTPSRLMTQHELYLDANSLLPAGISFMNHAYDAKNPNKRIMPYRGQSPDRRVEIRYLNYQRVEGRPVALEMQSSMNIIPSDSPDDLVSTIQISSVTFNTGVAVAVPAPSGN